MPNYINISSTDVIKLILQFLKENNLMRTFYILQEESNIKLNASSNVDGLISDIESGNWKSILYNIATLDLSEKVLVCFYEQLVCELIEYKEKELVEKIMNDCIIFKKMEKKYKDIFERLNECLSSTSVNKNILYNGSSKEKKRKELCMMINKEVTSIAPSRLLALLGMALKWQNYHNLLDCKNEDFDIFRNITKNIITSVDLLPHKIEKTISFGNETKIWCCIPFHHEEYLITGTSDGFIEIWNWITGTLNTDFLYQKENNLMMHDSGITCLCLRKDDLILLSGDSNGEIKIWNIKSGDCLETINGHTKAILSISFNKNETEILTSSYDGTIKIFGLKSKKCLKEFNKHSSPAYSALYNIDCSKIICGTIEGNIYIYNQKNCTCINNFGVYYKDGETIKFISVINIILISKNMNEYILVCSKSPCCYLMNMDGQIIKTYTTIIDKKEKENNKNIDLEKHVNFIYVAISPNYKYVYCLGENNIIYVFDYENCKLENCFKIDDEEPSSGILHHSKKSLMASWTLGKSLHIIQ